MYKILRKHLDANPLFLDFETKGNTPHLPETYVIGVALSSEVGTHYIDFRESYADSWRDFCVWMAGTKVPVAAHNVAFDALWPLRDFGIWFRWQFCTYAMYRHLASEGFPGQQWGLKAAQIDLLGWNESNQIELINWLLDNGHVVTSKSADLSKMHLAPPEIIGKYCALDAEATYLLFHFVLKPVLKRFPRYETYHTQYFIELVRAICEGYLRGINVDINGLRAYSVTLGQKIEASFKDFNSGRIREAIDKYNTMVLQEFIDREPLPAFKKTETLGLEPPKYRKDGKLSMTWQNWAAKKARIESTPPEETLHHKTWRLKVERMKALTARYHDLSAPELEEAINLGLFNIKSTKQKAWLFYNALGYTPERVTETGEPAIDDQALRLLGPEGAQLIAINEMIKEKSYVDAAIDYTYHDTIHVAFKAPGTLTGRCAGTGGFNLQQQPKTREYLQNFRARPGYAWIDVDLASIEPVVLTELSQDKNMLFLYGKDAKPNDIYLFVGAHISGIKEAIVATGYDPYNPTAAAMEAAKKSCKALRQLCKVVVLASQYGAGPAKIRETLKASNIEKSLEEVQAIHQAYWNLFAGIKTFERKLLAEWQRNKGWVINGAGRPITIAADYLKDIINRVVQSTGHDILMFYAAVVRRMLRSRGIQFYPVIADFHDQIIYEVPESAKDEALNIMLYEAFNEVREHFGVESIKGGGGIVYNLAEAKCE